MSDASQRKLDAFPVFLKVAGRMVVIVGNGDEALAKARLIGQSSARIRLIADAPEAGLRHWAVENGAELLETAYAPHLLEAAAMVFAATDDEGFAPCTMEGLTGWHRHPLYLEMRADTIRKVVEKEGLDLSAPGTRLVFSAHGTPIRYLEAGNGYARYVDEFCREVADLLGVESYALGFQNHTNRRIAWTEPDIESVIETIEADTVVVDPVSFMHEQSETLAELDHELRDEAEGRGLAFHRVPVPHDDPRYPKVLADLAEAFLSGAAARTAAAGAGAGPSAPGEGNPAGLHFGPCRCRPESGTWCLNSVPREVAAKRP